jgi:hypothetical protein
MSTETPPCAWCGALSVGEIRVEPARFRDRRVEHPRTGERVTIKQLTRQSIEVPVCERHAGLLDEQPLPLARKTSRKPGPEQLSLLDDVTSTPASAIYGDAA